jgi:heat shock protein HslJ
MRVRITVLILGAVLFSFFQCKTKVAKPDQGANPTENIPDAEKMRDTPYGLWILQEVQGSNVGVKKGTYIVLSEQKYYLYAGCNHIGGELRVRRDSMTIKPGPSTLMACTGMEYESALTKLLQTVGTFRRSGKQLSLFAGKGVVFTFQQQTPSEHLTGRNFVVAGLTMNGGVHFAADAPRQTMQFHSDGTLTGNGGCNSYSGSYKIEGDQLYISRVVSTKRACAEKEKREYESYLHQHLQKSPLRIEDSPSRVTLRDSTGSTVLVLEEG